MQQKRVNDKSFNVCQDRCNSSLMNEGKILCTCPIEQYGKYYSISNTTLNYTYHFKKENFQLIKCSN